MIPRSAIHLCFRKSIQDDSFGTFAVEQKGHAVVEPIKIPFAGFPGFGLGRSLPAVLSVFPLVIYSDFGRSVLALVGLRGRRLDSNLQNLMHPSGTQILFQ